MAGECDLSAVGFNRRYRRKSGVDMLTEFYIPMLQNSKTYDRVAGYFSSAVLSRASAGFAKFCKTANPREDDGIPKFRLIVGARLNPKDEAAILHIQDRDSINEIEDGILNSIQEMEEIDEYDFDRNRICGLAWMIQNGLLEIKVGVRFDKETGRIMSHNEAEFHPKFGIASDGINMMSFDGSVNETQRGWLKNYEKITVFRSWKGEIDRVMDNVEEFEILWNSDGKNLDEEVAIFSFPEAAKKKLLERFPPSSPESIDEVDWAKKQRAHLQKIGQMETRWKVKWTENDETPTTDDDSTPIDVDPEEIEGEGEEQEPSIWDEHQDAAVDWFTDPDQANGVGIFEMATGSGKTRTAMRCIRRLMRTDQIDRVVISVPNSLMRQWKEELVDFLKLSYKGGCIQHLKEMTADKKEHLEWKGLRRNAFLLVSHSMLAKFLAGARNWELTRTMIVIDEMHNAGANRFLKLADDAEKGQIGIDSSVNEKQIIEEEIAVLESTADVYESFDYRLGLSATPWSAYDDENRRNGFLVRNFTQWKDCSDEFFASDWQQKLRNEKKVFFFGLRQGIEKGILSEFDYHPIDFEPTDEEKSEYEELVRRGFGATNEQGEPSAIGAIRASAVFKGSREKIPAFLEWLETNPNLDRTVMFVEDSYFGADLMKALTEINYSNFTTFFQGDEDWNLDSFADFETNFVIACHRISEGISITSINQIILFSSASAPLETIQRIGRALRKKLGVSKTASVVDFIYDNPASSSNPDAARKAWLQKLSEARNPDE